jgi:hypothetical protein
MKLRINTGEKKMQRQFDAFMEKVVKVDKIFWVAGFFAIVIVANLVGYGS